MIKTVHIENFKCFEKFDIELDPFNVLIGPNDSGKTAFLQAIQLISGRSASDSKKMEIGSGKQLIWRNESKNEISIRFEVSTDECKERGHVTVKSSDGLSFSFKLDSPFGRKTPRDYEDGLEWFSQAVGKVGYYRFNPADLRKPSRPSQKMTSTGDGFPAFLDNILGDDAEIFISLADEFYQRFSHYNKLKVPREKQNEVDVVTLSFHTVKGENLPAESVSDGVMLSLAYLSLNYTSKPPKILLIEEPENGVHHASLKEIIGTLKKLSEDKKVQIILTTHSPYLLDCVEPENVRVFSKNKDGAAHAAKLSDHPEVDNLKKHFMTGEIWTELKEADIVANKGAAK